MTDVECATLISKVLHLDNFALDVCDLLYLHVVVIIFRILFIQQVYGDLSTDCITGEYEILISFHLVNVVFNAAELTHSELELVLRKEPIPVPQTSLVSLLPCVIVMFVAKLKLLLAKLLP